MIQHKQFETAAEYVDWVNKNADTQVASVVQQYADGDWKTLVIYLSPVAVPSLRLQA